jgi:hypothetical protein
VTEVSTRGYFTATTERDMSTGDMVLNIGPQHPSTHGVLRVVARLDGERVVEAEPVLGYMHRAFEKLAEQRTPLQNTALFNRLDWVSGFCNEVPYCIACEQLAGIEIPKRAVVQRVILFELTRLASHALFCGIYGLELGALTPPMYGYRDREYALDLLEMATGQRMHTNWARIGGVKEDFPEGFLERIPPVLEYFRTRVEQWLEFLIDNDIFVQRTRGIGELPVTSPSITASRGRTFEPRVCRRTHARRRTTSATWTTSSRSRSAREETASTATSSGCGRCGNPATSSSKLWTTCRPDPSTRVWAAPSRSPRARSTSGPTALAARPVTT